jgi:hypothetical protein
MTTAKKAANLSGQKSNGRNDKRARLVRANKFAD